VVCSRVRGSAGTLSLRLATTKITKVTKTVHHRGNEDAERNGASYWGRFLVGNVSATSLTTSGSTDLDTKTYASHRTTPLSSRAVPRSVPDAAAFAAVRWDVIASTIAAAAMIHRRALPIRPPGISPSPSLPTAGIHDQVQAERASLPAPPPCPPCHFHQAHHFAALHSWFGRVRQSPGRNSSGCRRTYSTTRRRFS